MLKKEKMKLTLCSHQHHHSVINEGQDFQADIPPLQQRQDVNSDSHNALLLWTVQDHLEHPDNQLRSKLNVCTKQ